MCHHERLRTGALLGIFLHEGIVLGDLPLLIVESAVGIIVFQAFAVAVNGLVAVRAGLSDIVFCLIVLILLVPQHKSCINFAKIQIK